MDRLEKRTVFIYNVKGDNEEIGGLGNTQGITNKKFYDMLEIILVFHSPCTLALAGGGAVPKDGAELKLGKYSIDGKFTATHAHFVALLICNRDFFYQ